MDKRDFTKQELIPSILIVFGQLQHRPARDCGIPILTLLQRPDGLDPVHLLVTTANHLLLKILFPTGIDSSLK